MCNFQRVKVISLFCVFSLPLPIISLPLLLPLFPVITPSFLFPHAHPLLLTSFSRCSSSSCWLCTFCFSLKHQRWSSWSRSTEPSAGRWSPSTWRDASASSAVSAGTTTWTQRSRRPRGPRRRTESSTKLTRSWETAGQKSPSCFLAGEAENEEGFGGVGGKREAGWITEPLLVSCATLRLGGRNRTFEKAKQNEK